MLKIFTITLFLLLSTFLNAKDIFSIDKELRQEIEKHYSKDAKEKIENLIILLNDIKDKNETIQITKINNFFNAIKYKSDMKVWDKKDYWASRIEFIDQEMGDCEDYVIAKYFSLIQLGITKDRIFLTYVKAIKYKQAHMVLTYYKKKGTIPLVLDNIVKEILPATKRKDLRPIFSFNGEKIYMAKMRGLGKEIPQGKVNLTKWTNLILKIKREKQ
jgi:predicted transglutaminase-like cysteine proteinase